MNPIEGDYMSEELNLGKLEVDKLTEDQLQSHHFDLLLEVAYLARENNDLQGMIVANQDKISYLSERLDSLDLELELREAKSSGPLS